jgi:uncharacterized OB-fold protein
MTIRKTYKLVKGLGEYEWKVVGRKREWSGEETDYFMGMVDYPEGGIVQLTQRGFGMVFREVGMEVEMTAEEVAEEREITRESMEVLRNGEYL